MSSLTLKQVGKTYNTHARIIQSLDLEIRDGEFMVFVGPSGCGKTTLLRMIAGLEDISEGEIYFDDELVNDIPPAHRGSAMVFQSYALYPHLTVAENLSFGLKMAGVSKVKQAKAVDAAAEVLQIKQLLDRKPKELSGGQRQRVAIGRAIVRKPKVFLFDEPLSNLDANLRVKMRVELTRLHAELGTTMIYVTHDQVEAMTLGQRIAVFNAGKIEQVGVPLEIYHYPANLFVAEFMGSPKMNMLPCAAVPTGANHWRLDIDGAGHLDIGTEHIHPENARTLGVRPEHFVLASKDKGIRAKVSLIEQLGESTVVYALIQSLNREISMRMNGSVQSLQIGQDIYLGCKSHHIRLFDVSGNAIAMSRQLDSLV
jgi:multiple sugar transport system ATP-binding protein